MRIAPLFLAGCLLGGGDGDTDTDTGPPTVDCAWMDDPSNCWRVASG